LMRVDFNVPFDVMGNVSDDTRILGALPTIKYLVESKAKVILMSHLGRPKGQRIEKYSLRPVAVELEKLLGQPVSFANDCKGEVVQGLIEKAEPGAVVLLENLRFYKEEEANDLGFAKELASLGEVYVNDAFGAAHRAHASTVGITQFIEEKAGGLLMEKELNFLGHQTANPEHPFVVILGGAKVSDKINVINSLLDKADVMLIGGAMAYTFALAMGQDVGDSLVEIDKVGTAKAAIEKAKDRGVKLLLPVDHLVADSVDFKNGTLGETSVIAGGIESGWQGVDIGPDTVDLYKEEVTKAKTLLWNGPMGIFEIPESSKGTFAVAEAVAKR